MGDMSREPSMEDILSSIRRVIARDEAPGARAQRAAAPSEDILDPNEEEEDAVDDDFTIDEEDLEDFNVEDALGDINLDDDDL